MKSLTVTDENLSCQRIQRPRAMGMRGIRAAKVYGEANEPHVGGWGWVGWGLLLDGAACNRVEVRNT